MATTAIYVRLSDDRRNDGLAVARQEKDCRAFCKQHGFTNVELYSDNDISAYSGKKRPAYLRMCDDVANGRVDRIVVWHPDRLHRSPKELEAFIDLVERAGVDVRTVTAGDYDLTTPEGRFTARIVGAVARKESEDKSRRLTRKHLEIAEAGALAGNHFGNRGYGYELVVVDGKQTREVVPEEADIIRDLAARFIAGEALYSLCRDLNARRVPTPKGKSEWNATSLRQLLESPRISGQRTLRGVIVAKAQWDPIITPEQTDQIQRLLDANSDRYARAPRSYLLSGLGRCGRCGGRLLTGYTRNAAGAPKRHQYRCMKRPGRINCGGVAIKRESLDEFVTEITLQAIDGPELAAMIRRRSTNRSARTTALQTVERGQAKLDDLARTYADDLISMSEWLEARTRVEDRIQTARAELDNDALAPLIPITAAAGSLRNTWPQMPLTRQHAIVAAIIDHVTIDPAIRGRKTFDPDRVDITWRA